MISGFLAAFVSVFMVFLGGWFAWRNGMLTLQQMYSIGCLQGLPFVWHFGIMWGDLFILSPMLGVILARYGEWSTRSVILASVAAGVASWGMHQTYKNSRTPQAHVEYGELTPAGEVHLVYMAYVLAIIFLFLFAQPRPTASDMIWVSVLLTVHTILGTNMVLGLIAPAWFPEQPLRNPATWIIVVGCAAGLAAISFARIHGMW